MAIFSWRPAYGVVASGVMLSVLACGAVRLNAQTNAQTSEKAAALLGPLTEDGGAVCALNEGVTAQGGSYSANVNLSASIALPGTKGVDVVMTRQGAIAAVETETGAALHWVNPETGEIMRSRDFPSAIRDIAYDGQDTLAIAMGDKVMKLAVTDGTSLSELRLPGADRVAIAPDGHIAAIANKTVHLYDADSRELFARERNYVAVTDVEILSCGDNRPTVYVSSFRNSDFTDLNGNYIPVQIARLEAFDAEGEMQWSLFGDSPDTIKQNIADTRLYRVTLGRDGYLYIVGESAGTATIFRWQGQPMTEDEQYGRVDSFLTRIDPHSQLHNSASAHITYYARVHPTEGRIVTSQLSFPRLPNEGRVHGISNTMRVGDIAAGADGTVYFGGIAFSFIANRDNLTLNGESVGEYNGGDRTWMSVAPDFRTRNFWTVLADESGKGKVSGVDAGYGYSAAISNAESGTVPVTTGGQDSSVFLSFTAE
ncbi:MAG: hypothetical protein AAGM27_02480 [Cyanobacteria bacterium J06554_3]